MLTSFHLIFLIYGFNFILHWNISLFIFYLNLLCFCSLLSLLFSFYKSFTSIFLEKSYLLSFSCFSDISYLVYVDETTTLGKIVLDNPVAGNTISCSSILNTDAMS